MANKPVVWVLADDRAGNVNQCLGVAEALGLGFSQKDIRYNSFAKLPNVLLGATLCGVTKESRDSIKAPWPDIVIAAGRRTAPVARYIKKQSENKTTLVQIMHPGRSGAADFDLICVPVHDGKTLASNEMSMVGAPHRVNETKLAAAKEHWQDSFADLPAPKIALIVGGATKDKVFNEAMAAQLGRMINQMAQDQNGSLLVTTSRRTGQAAEALLSEIDVPSYRFKWGDEGENPYFGFLSHADYIVVTGDSVSMCSEACATGKPVLIYAPGEMISDKHKRMVQSLYDTGCAGPFEGGLMSNNGQPLNAAKDIAARIREICGL